MNCPNRTTRVKNRFLNLRWLLLLLSCLLPTVPYAGDEVSARVTNEYKLKAAYLFNFAKFTHWSHLEGSSQGKLDLCVSDIEKFGGLLEKANNRKISKLSLKVSTVAPGDSIKFCEILFVDKESENQWYEQLQQHPSLLTVGETKGFLSAGGVIQFFIDKKKLRFAIHFQHLNERDFQIEGRMLRLAKKVAGEK